MDNELVSPCLADGDSFLGAVSPLICTGENLCSFGNRVAADNDFAVNTAISQGGSGGS